MLSFLHFVKKIGIKLYNPFPITVTAQYSYTSSTRPRRAVSWLFRCGHLVCFRRRPSVRSVAVRRRCLRSWWLPAAPQGTVMTTLRLQPGATPALAAAARTTKTRSRPGRGSSTEHKGRHSREDGDSRAIDQRCCARWMAV